MLPNTAWCDMLLVTTVSAVTTPNIRQLFGPILSEDALIYLSSEPDYSAHVSQRWSTHKAPSYIGTIQPATVEDVENIVKIAASHKIPFLATGGGHGVSIQMATLHDGIQIDLRKFNSVHFDAKNQLLTVGGSVIFSQLIDPLSEAGAQFPLGTAYCVGMVGATLGAGVSSGQGYIGLLSDLLEEVQLVTSTGNTVTASHTKNSDLFWALRGAGANFGVVTSATYRVPKTVNDGNVTNINFLFPASKAMGVFEYLESLDSDMPAELALNIAIVFDPNAQEVIFFMNANFAGPAHIAEHYLAPLMDLEPLRSEVLNVRWPDVFSTSYFGIEDTKACGRNQHVNMRSIGAKHTNPEALVAFIQELDSFNRVHTDLPTSLVIHRFATQKVLEVPDHESAYPHRELKMHFQLESEYNDRGQDDIVDAFLQAARYNLTAASGFDEPTVYVNFAHGDEGPEAWYGAPNLERLTRLKREWDPNGLFSFYNAVPVNEPEISEL